MNKKICALLVVAIMLFSCPAAFATTAEATPSFGEATSAEQPYRFNGIMAIDSGFAISNSGLAAIECFIHPQSATAISYVDITVNLTDNTGYVIETWEERLYKSSFGTFDFDETHQLTARGEYYAHISGVAKKSGSTVDTFSFSTVRDEY